MRITSGICDDICSRPRGADNRTFDVSSPPLRDHHSIRRAKPCDHGPHASSCIRLLVRRPARTLLPVTRDLTDAHKLNRTSGIIPTRPLRLRFRCEDPFFVSRDHPAPGVTRDDMSRLSAALVPVAFLFTVERVAAFPLPCRQAARLSDVQR